MTRVPASFVVSSCLLAAPAITLAADAAVEELSPVEVSATRLRSVADLDVPASVSVVRLDPDNNRAQTQITELLGGLPGVTALDRQNYAQDTQLSIRGFGSRATFGVRGLRLYADGIPASMPDGQGQLSHFSVLGADNLQIMRGPFSALYGNSSGGVVQIWSRPGTEEPSARVRATYGSDDTRNLGAQLLGSAGATDYNLSLSRFQTDGYREHAAARRDSANLRVGVDLGAGRTLAFVANYVDIPEAQDTLGLTPAEWRADPRQATAVATQFNTRKSVEQLQGGVIYEQRVGAGHTLRAAAYTGNRQVVQFLAIPTATQTNNALHAGGVIDLDSDYRGADLRWSWTGELLARPLELTLGGNYDLQDQLRRGYTNFVGTTLGVRGVLRRDETNRVDNFDQFGQAWWQFADRWSVLAGIRHTAVKFRSRDRYVVGPNGDDSGSKRYGDTTVVGGLMFRATDALRLYASVGDGFETPTFNEMSYRADGTPGLAFNLRPAVSRNHELGAKWRGTEGAELDIALFRASTRDDLVVVRNTGGRSSFGNVDRTRRQGVESALRLPLPASWQLDVAYSLVDAEFRSDYLTCTGFCTTPTAVVPAGSPIPGVPRHQGRVRLNYSPGEWNAALELSASSSLVVRDVPGVDRAPGYALWHAEFGRRWQLDGSALRLFARVENLLDRRYVGSVIVNEGNGRYFESGPDRSALLGVQWSWR